jgi:hypothetical protein
MEQATGQNLQAATMAATTDRMRSIRLCKDEVEVGVVTAQLKSECSSSIPIGLARPQWRAQLWVFKILSLLFFPAWFRSGPFHSILGIFGTRPLQFVYSKICHYNFISSPSMPFSTAAAYKGPLAKHVCGVGAGARRPWPR